MLSTLIAVMAEPTVNTTLSWGVGGGALTILLLLMAALVAFGGGRDHS
jgi:hypothetical protein